MKMKIGDSYSRSDMQDDLKTIYETGFFSEKMKAVPTNNDDGTVTYVTLKIHITVQDVIFVELVCLSIVLICFIYLIFDILNEL